MKQLFLSFILSVIITAAMAQMPKAINYQAVARNAQGQALANQNIKVRLSIVSSAGGNPTLYSETRSVTTNALGLFNVQIGSAGATATTGNFITINWTNNTQAAKSLKVELDVNNSGSFTDMGSQLLVSVPYAFAADNAINIGGRAVSTNTPNVGDVLKWDGSAWVPHKNVAFAAEGNVSLTVGTPAMPLTFADKSLDNTNSVNANGKFKAPVSGVYFLTFFGNFSTTAASDIGSMAFRSNLQGNLGVNADQINFKINTEDKLITFSQIVTLSAGEEVDVYLMKGSFNGTWTVRGRGFKGFQIN